MSNDKTMIITSSAFTDNGFIPKRHTGFGEDISPDLRIENLPDAAVSLAIVMFDLDIPLIGKYTHWVIWNIPATDTIPENIPYGEFVSTLNAVQGTAYGKNRYKGPKQPFFVRGTHRYEFNVFALDTSISLSSSSNAAELLSAMQSHILAQGRLTGKYKR